MADFAKFYMAILPEFHVAVPSKFHMAVNAGLANQLAMAKLTRFQQLYIIRS